MDFGNLTRRAMKLASDNSPVILTAIGVVGTLTTAFLTGKATAKYVKLLAEEGYYDRDYKFDRSTKEHFKTAWKLYIPPAGAAITTIACIILANRIGTRRAAAVAAAYAISEKAFDEYRAKVAERIGQKKEQAFRDEIAQERVTADPRSNAVIIASNKALFYDAYTGRYFESDMETVRKAVNDTNYQVNNDFYASLSDFYERIGLSRTDVSEEMGWNADKLLDVEYSAVLAEDGRPCISISFKVAPIRGYHRLS